MTDISISSRFTDLQAVWERLSQSDPLWAVLSDPERKGGKWDIVEFFKTGEQEIATIQSFIGKIGYRLPANGPSLDFGCGVGRLTQAIARHLTPVIGVDISQGMVDAANRLNRQGEACEFICNSGQMLPFADSYFTFIYSSIVLQHIPRPFADQYIAEFIRVLRPGCLAIFQTCDIQKGPPPKQLVHRWQALKATLGIRTRLRRLLTKGSISERDSAAKSTDYSMNSIPEPDVRRLIEKAGGTVLDVQLTNSTDADFNGALQYLNEESAYGFVSKQFSVTK